MRLHLFKREGITKFSVTIVAMFLMVAMPFVSCDVNKTEPQTTLVDVQSRKAQWNKKFAGLSQALQAMDPATATPDMFKAAALKYFAGVDKSDGNYAQAKANYEASFQQVKRGHSRTKGKSLSPSGTDIDGAITELITRIQRLDSYKEADQVFKSFYADVQGSDEYSVEEKNKLLSSAVYYQSVFDFMAGNHRMLGAIYNLSEYRTIKAREFNQQCDEQQYAEEGDSYGEEDAYEDGQQSSDPLDPGDVEECSEENEGWWDSWGRCAAGITGGAGLGALTGAGYGGAGCTMIVPGIGTVACGVVGAVAGGIAGGLAGASQSCY